MTTQNLNPVRIMTVQDWENLADVSIEFSPKLAKLNKLFVFKLLQTRYESEVFKPLERKHFVCEVEKPQCYEVVRAELAVPSQSQYDLCVDYDNAQSDLIFEGFEEKNQFAVKFDLEVLSIHFGQYKQTNSLVTIDIPHAGFSKTDINMSIFGFIYHISKYNETATNKIELKFTEAFIKKIIQ